MIYFTRTAAFSQLPEQILLKNKCEYDTTYNTKSSATTTSRLMGRGSVRSGFAKYSLNDIFISY